MFSNEDAEVVVRRTEKVNFFEDLDRTKFTMEKEKKDIFLKNIEEQKINKIRIVELCRKIVNIVVNN